MKTNPESERKKYTEDLLNQYFENSNDMLCIADHTGYFRLLNPQWERVLGYSNAELMEKPYISLVHPDDVESTIKAAQDLSFQTKVYGFTNRYRCKDGTYRWLEWHSYPKDALVFATVRDVTERKIIEEKLERLHNLHSAILENAGYSIITTDTSGIITSVNRTGEELLGYNKGELTGLDVGVTLHSREEMIRHAAMLSEKLGQPVNAGFEVFIAEARMGKPHEYEWTYIRKDGKHLPVLLKVTSLIDSKKEIIGYMGIASDLTEKKRDLEIFRQSEQRFTDVFNLSPDIIIITRQSDGRVLSANPALDRVSGYTKADYLNRSTLELNWWVNPDDRIKILNELKVKGEVNNHEVNFRRKNGEIITSYFSARPIIYNDEFCLISVINDITELKKKENLVANERNMLRRLIDNIPDIVYIKDTESRFIIANETLAQIIGTTVEDLLGKTDLEFFPENQANDFLNDEKILFKTGKPVIKKEETLNDTQGNAIIFQTTKLPLRNPEGQIIGLVGSGHIITEHKKAEEEIRQLNRDLEKRVQERTEKLQQAYKELEAFSYSLSHDLRAPLRHADVNIRKMLENLPPQYNVINEYAGKTLSVLKRMGTLIDAMLSFTSLSRKELVMTNLDLNSLILEIVERFHLETVNRNISWKIHPLPRVWGDLSLLHLAFENILSNAVKYTAGRNEPVIEVGAVELPDKKKEIYIRDNGVGFDMAYAGKLFGVFQRLHSHDEFEGTGIGLANVKQIITKHNGSIRAEGKVNEGATFYITLTG